MEYEVKYPSDVNIEKIKWPKASKIVADVVAESLINITNNIETQAKAAKPTHDLAARTQELIDS
jgi:hypothetical protein